MNHESAYSELIRLAREQAILSSCADLLEWDEETYMTRGGVSHRAEQSAVLAGLLHERQTSPRFGELLAVVADSNLVSNPESAAAVNVRELKRTYLRQVRLPRAHVEEHARVTTLAQQVWVEAREESDYSRLCPWLEKIVGLTRREAAALGHGGDPYDALLENYEPGITTAEVAALFANLRSELAPLLASITAARKRPRTSMLRREFPVDRQKLFAQAVAAAVGFDLKRGRLDVAAHPFCMAIGPGDTRLTMRYAERSFGDGFFAMLHEVGHGLYEQGLPVEHYGTPMGSPASLGMHESQSRLWENLVGRGLPFWKHFFPRLKNVFHEALADVKVDTFHLAINRVEPSPLRATADEVTYNMHIMIRFELERALLSESLKPADLPGAWREAYKAHLGVEPRDDVEGCLQDGHWAEGLFGYFPTYTLGNVYAAQLHAVAGSDDQFEHGEFGGVLKFLRENVHSQGMRYSSPELVRRATGQASNHRALVSALKRKYSALYGL
jgi:carboxypeptidase Taq